MEPRHPQPFTAAEARHLDVNVIVTEISRLQNSLAHLVRTQEELLTALVGEEDRDLREAWVENEGVIESQKERIEMLRGVLGEKVGEESLAHYGVSSTAPAAPSTQPANGEGLHL